VNLDATLRFNRSNNFTVSNTVTGSSSGNLVQAGSGKLTLSGVNTYMGSTTLSAGTLALDGSGAIGSSGTISFGGGTLQYAASNTTDYSQPLQYCDQPAVPHRHQRPERHSCLGAEQLGRFIDQTRHWHPHPVRQQHLHRRHHGGYWDPAGRFRQCVRRRFGGQPSVAPASSTWQASQ
jgi:autotransporter-associated beta strand protein